MNLLRHWPERIVAVTDGEGEGELGALIEYRKLEADEQPEASDVEYVRADLYVARLRALIEAAEAARHRSYMDVDTVRAFVDELAAARAFLGEQSDPECRKEATG